MSEYLGVCENGVYFQMVLFIGMMINHWIWGFPTCSQNRVMMASPCLRAVNSSRNVRFSVNEIPGIYLGKCPKQRAPGFAGSWACFFFANIFGLRAISSTENILLFHHRLIAKVTRNKLIILYNYINYYMVFDTFFCPAKIVGNTIM